MLLAIAQYITNLGYRAVASMNDSAVAIPLAIKAGLGEYGRHGLLITREYGPRVRLGKVFTDMPLAHDRPVRFGVKETCDICRACTNGCPAKAIDDGEPSTVVHIDRTFKASENGPLMPRNASASGPTRTPTARSACASAHTTATIATGGVECGDGWRARGSGDSRFGWTASVDAVSASDRPIGGTPRHSTDRCGLEPPPDGCQGRDPGLGRSGLTAVVPTGLLGRDSHAVEFGAEVGEGGGRS